LIEGVGHGGSFLAMTGIIVAQSYRLVIAGLDTAIPTRGGTRGIVAGTRPAMTFQETFFTRPQPLSACQMPRSRRKRSIGADDLMALMR